MSLICGLQDTQKWNATTKIARISLICVSGECVDLHVCCRTWNSKKREKITTKSCYSKTTYDLPIQEWSRDKRQLFSEETERSLS